MALLGRVQLDPHPYGKEDYHKNGRHDHRECVILAPCCGNACGPPPRKPLPLLVRRGPFLHFRRPRPSGQNPIRPYPQLLSLPPPLFSSFSLSLLLSLRPLPTILLLVVDHGSAGCEAQIQRSPLKERKASRMAALAKSIRNDMDDQDLDLSGYSAVSFPSPPSRLTRTHSTRLPGCRRRKPPQSPAVVCLAVEV